MCTSCTHTRSAEARSTNPASRCIPVPVNSTFAHTGGNPSTASAPSSASIPNGWSSGPSARSGGAHLCAVTSSILPAGTDLVNTPPSSRTRPSRRRKTTHSSQPHPLRWPLFRGAKRNEIAGVPCGADTQCTTHHGRDHQRPDVTRRRPQPASPGVGPPHATPTPGTGVHRRATGGTPHPVSRKRPPRRRGAGSRRSPAPTRTLGAARRPPPVRRSPLETTSTALVLARCTGLVDVFPRLGSYEYEPTWLVLGRPRSSLASPLS